MANVNRSPTFEEYFNDKYDNIECRSAGTHGGPNVVNEEILDWADLIFVMDLEQEMIIRRKFGNIYNKKMSVIGVSDQYDYGDGYLLDVIKYWDEYYFNKMVIKDVRPKFNDMDRTI